MLADRALSAFGQGNVPLQEPLSEAQNEDQAQSSHDGDDIFLFGFSRGAFTARSLAGLINRCGVLKQDQFKPGEKIEPTHEPGAESLEALRQTLDVKTSTGKEGLSRNHPQCEAFGSRIPGFQKLSSWASGTRWEPWAYLGCVARIYPGVRHVSLSRYEPGRVIKNGYHACAIDENRRDFELTLWTARTHQNQIVEQRWFPGAHANVGGGYEDDTLPDPPLKWLAEKAITTG